MTCFSFCSLSTFFKCVSLCFLYDYYENTYMCVCVFVYVSRYKSCFYNSSTGACKIAGVYVMLYVYNVPSFLFLQLSNSLYLYKNSIWLYKVGSKIYKISYKACSKGSSDYSMHFLLTRLNWDLKTKKAINATSSQGSPDSIQYDYKGCICICMIDRLID